MSEYQVISLSRNDSDTGWLLRVGGLSETALLGAWIWPSGVPPAVTITLREAVTDPAPVGDFEITGITFEALQAMDPSWSAYFTTSSVITADPSPAQPQPAGGGRPETPEPGDRERAERLKEYILDGAHGAFTVGEIASMFAEEGSAIAVVGEVAGGFGDVLAVATVLYETWHAFGEGLRDEENRGAMYGLVWQVIGHPDQEPQYNEDNVFGKLPWDSWDEMKHAFDEGVAKGRAMAADPKTNNRVAAAIAWRMYHNGEDANMAASLVLNEIWQHATGGTKHQFVDFP